MCAAGYKRMTSESEWREFVSKPKVLKYAGYFQMYKIEPLSLHHEALHIASLHRYK